MSKVESFIWRARIDFDVMAAASDPDTEGDFGCVMEKIVRVVEENVPGVTIPWDNIDPLEGI